MGLGTKKKSMLNGVDCLMLAFDYQLRKNGFAGNMAQIILELPGCLSAAAVKQRLTALVMDFPILRAGLVQRFWIGYPFLSNGIRPLESGCDCVFVHDLRDVPARADRLAERQRRRKDIFNTPLRIHKGQWLRFDLIYFDNDATELIMTWHHVLMDAHGAEYFLYMIGNGGPPQPVPPQPVLFQQRLAAMDTRAKWQQARQAFERIDSMAEDRPVSLYTVLQSQTVPKLDYRLHEFSLPETEAVLAVCKSAGGVLNDSAFFLANSLVALDRLHQAKQVDTGSYVVSFPVDLRRIGARAPVFGNQAGTLLYAFKKADLTDMNAVMQSFRAQTQAAVRQDMLFANFCTLDLSRFMPSWLYMRKIRQTLNGEIASLVFANPGKTYAGLSEFLGRKVTCQYHVPSVVAPPGIGIVFYTFAGRLVITLVFVEGLLTAAEADGFLGGICSRLTGKA